MHCKCCLSCYYSRALPGRRGPQCTIISTQPLTSVQQNSSFSMVLNVSMSFGMNRTGFLDSRDLTKGFHDGAALGDVWIFGIANNRILQTIQQIFRYNKHVPRNLGCQNTDLICNSDFKMHGMVIMLVIFCKLHGLKFKWPLILFQVQNDCYVSSQI